LSRKVLFFIAFIAAAFFTTSSAQTLRRGTSPLPVVDPGNNPLHRAEIMEANSFRLIINIIAEEDSGSTSDFKKLFRQKIDKYIMPADAAFAKKLIARVETDTSLMKECKYLLNIKNSFSTFESKHFVFYYPSGKEPDGDKTAFWDEQYERLSKLFNSQVNGKITFIIDPNDQYGRAFPPWEIGVGIRQKELDGNPHELVHCLLFKYSDVPFFHEPLAFIYGTSMGDMQKEHERLLRYAKTLASGKYITSTELIHFPQIIGLDNIKWASAYCFVYMLNEKYGTEKLLNLMKENTWHDTTEKYLSGFKKIYGVELKEYEDDLRKMF
jgi:hypothetical protein